ncbi:MAG: ABC transporter substrate-binding protein [Actinomycetota bacterium]|jgi:putative spermidine/putrescine transport system substrate-binding protein|nr:MAG: ABC transporter substrate-binding protein [Actinomycetota bacterium]
MGGNRYSRREFIKRGGALAGALALPGVLAACGRTPEQAGTGASPTGAAIDTGNIAGTKIKVGTYGGFFEENFRKMYPAFTEETGVEVESVSQPTSETWVVQLEQAAKAGAVPADVSMLSIVGMLRAIKGDILATYDPSNLQNREFLADGFVRTNDAGQVVGVGAVSWYITLVSNTDRVPESPDSWSTLWDPRWRNELALLRNPGNSFLLEITAATHFGGYDVLQTQEGVEEVLAKLAEVKPNVKLWYRDEATAQQAFNTGEVSLGQFYHDITTYAASQGEPLRSVFPTEGAILDSGEWAITKTTQNLAGCVAFIDYMCRPEIQAELARTLGTSPTVKREFMDLTDEEYEAFSGPGPDAALRPEYRIYDEWEDWINQRWSELIVGVE